MKKQKIESVQQDLLRLIKEEIEIAKMNQELVEQRKDFYSLIAIALIEESTGKPWDDPMLLDEGIWSTLKHWTSKLGSLEKGGKLFGGKKEKAKQYAAKVAPALKSASGQAVQGLLDQLKKEHGDFPNNKENEDFSNALEAIAASYDSVAAAVKAGEMEAVAANELIDALRNVVEYYRDNELSDVYKHFKEGEELEGEVLNEVNLNRLLRLVSGGEMDPMVALRRVEKAMGRPGRGETERAAYDQIKRIAHNMYGGQTTGPGLSPTTVGPGVTPSPGPAPMPTPPSPGPVPNLGTSPNFTGAAQGIGATGLSTGATVAYWAGVLGIAAVASGVAVAALRAKGRHSSRTQQFGALLASMTDVESQTPVIDKIIDDPQQPVEPPVSPPDDPQQPIGPGPTPPAGEGIFVYKGVAGKGLQSTLDKAGIPGNIKSIVLKHIAAQLKKQGLTVQELKSHGFPLNLLVEESPADEPPEEEEESETTDKRKSAPEGTQAALQQKKVGTSGAPQVGVYNHPAGKQYSLNQALQDADYAGEDLSKLMDMIAAWGKAQGLKINENALRGILDNVLSEARIARWKQLLRG
jgi:soluble cytochrome b562